MSRRPPSRWMESHDAPIGVRELLSAARPTRALDDARRERGAARVARLGAAPIAAAAAVSTWVKLAAAAGIGLATTTAVVATHAWSSQDVSVSERQPRAAIVPAPLARDAIPLPSPAIIEAPSTVPETAPTPSPRAVLAPKIEIPTVVESPAPPASPSPEAPAKRAPSTLADELVVIEAARAKITRDPSSALAHVAEHRARWPHGVLSAERDLIELEALRHVGREADARGRASAWLAREPSGPYAARLRALARD